MNPKQCPHCDESVAVDAEVCPHCEMPSDPKAYAELEAKAKAMFDQLDPETRKEFERLAAQTSDADEFVNQIMIGDCPKCESSKTTDCEEDDAIDSLLIARCKDCGCLWCSDCDEQLANEFLAAAHECEETVENTVKAILEASNEGVPIEDVLTPGMLDALWVSADTAAGAAAILADIEATTYEELPILPILMAQRHYEEVKEGLVKIVTNALAVYRKEGEVDGMGHIVAMYLLAEFEAEELLSVLLDILRLPDEGASDLLGESLHDDVAPILASQLTNFDVLDELIRDKSRYEFSRWQAALTFVYLMRDGKLSREEACDRLGKHLDFAVNQKDYEVATGIVSAMTTIALPSSIASLERAFASGCVDDSFILSLDDIKAFAAQGEDEFQEVLANLPASGIEDALKRAKDSGVWDEDEDDLDEEDLDEEEWGEDEEPDPLLSGPSPVAVHFSDDDESADGFGEDYLDGDPPTIRNEGNKVGRNDPCPCQSGKKYKKCCGRR